MNPKIKSFLTKKSNILKVSGQLAVFKGNQVTVTGLDFLYRLTVLGANVDPPIYVNLSDFTMAASLLEEFEEIKRLPNKLVLTSRHAKMALPLREDNPVIPEAMVTEGETVDIGDDFVVGLSEVYRFFQPQTIYFMNKNRIFLHNSLSSYLGVINTQVPSDICGNYGSVSEDAVIIPGAEASWMQLPNSWHLVLYQKVGNEELYMVFSAMTPADISVVKDLVDVVDNVYSLLQDRSITFVIPDKLARLITIPTARHIKVTGDRLILYTDTFEASFDIDVETRMKTIGEHDILTSVLADLFSKVAGKAISLIFGDEKRYIYYSSDDNLCEIISPF